MTGITWITNKITRTITLMTYLLIHYSENLGKTFTNKDIFKTLEDKYYDCETVDQFLRVKVDNSTTSPLLNLDFYELVGLEIISDDEDENRLSDSYMKAGDDENKDTMFAYFGVISKLIFVQMFAAMRGALAELFSTKR